MKTEKCDRCKQEWTLPDNYTKMVYCQFCYGMFCLYCWFKQRDEEYNKGFR